MPNTLLAANILTGVSSFVVTDVAGIPATDYFLLLGIWGSENSEIVRITNVVAATNTVSINVATTKPHSESTPVTLLKYNQVRFYWTAADTFSASIPVTGYTDLDPTSYFTTALDTVHPTGFGWFVYYDSVHTISSANSNAIPYANFNYSSVKRIVDAFYSSLNQVQQRLIAYDDALTYLNEAYSLARAELNLVSSDWATSAETTLSVLGGTQEYALPDRFSDLIYIRNGTTGLPMNLVRNWEIPENEKYGTGNIGYYLRGNWIGFSPVPTQSFTVLYSYAQLPTYLTSYYDTVSLPDDNYWFLLDYMRFRAANKLNRDGSDDFKNWRNGLDLMKQVSINRGTNQDSWRSVRSSWV